MRDERLLAERLEAEHLAAREQRRVDRERRVLGGGADQRDRARLDVGQEGVLLRLVEAVDLVDEEDGALAAVVAPLLRRARRSRGAPGCSPSTAENGTKTALVRAR